MPRSRSIWSGVVLLVAFLFLTLAHLQTARAERVNSQNSTSLILPLQQDAYILSSQPDRNFGTDHLAVAPSAQAYIQFDLTTLPANAEIEHAVLRLTPLRLADGASVNISAGRVESAWSENQITWNTKPAIAPARSTVTVASLDWVEWTVTELVKSWQSGQAANHGFVLGAKSGSVLFHSAEIGPAPELVLFLQSENEPGTLALSQQVDTGDKPVRAGDVITYTINLKHEGGTAPLQAELRNVLDARLRLASRVYVEETSFRVRVDYQRDAEGRSQQVISGQGTLDPDADLTFIIPVRVQATCAVGEASQTITNEVIARIPGSKPIQSVAEWVRPCPSHGLDDIEVTLELGDDEVLNRDGSSIVVETSTCCDGSFGVQEYLALGGPDTTTRLRITLTNHSQEPVILGYHLQTDYIGETEKSVGQIASGHQQFINTANVRDSYNIDRPGLVTHIILRPEETRTVNVWTDMRPLSLHLDSRNGSGNAAEHSDSDDEMEVDVNFYYTILPIVEEGAQISLDAPTVATKSLKVRYRPWDLGDAPDSSNHFAVTMQAYPSVQANFPTVYDLEVNPTQIGPVHARPRYFYLGRSVSLEPDADLETVPNIHPSSNTADQDTFDDGTVPHIWNLVHCQSTMVDVRVFISPDAVTWFQQQNLRGYLNGWIDGSRDGDWGDVVGCDGGRAFEHLIIDHPVDVVALGPGYHTISVPTGPALWPADKTQQPAWVRVSLSERPSVKVGNVSGVQFGDGRGPEQPFRTGETEDYLLRPNGSTGAGPDMEVNMVGAWRPVLDQEVLTAEATFTYQKIEWTLRTDFANRGTEAAQNVVLTFDVPQGLHGQDAELLFVSDKSEVAVEDYVASDDLITVNLGTVAPQQRGRLLVTFRPEIGDEVIVAYESKATITSDRDINPERNTASFKVEIEGVTQGAFGFRSPGASFAVQQGTTNSRDLILEGTVQSLLLPAVQKIWVHSVLTSNRSIGDIRRSNLPAPGEPIEVQVEQNGRWTYSLNNLADGVYQFAVGDPAACDSNFRTLGGNDNEWHSLHGYGTVCGLAVVDSSLAMDPISLRFIEVPADAAAQVRTFLPDTSNWSQGNWRLRIFDTNPEDGETRYKVSVNGRPGSELILGITGFGSFENKLVEISPGRYETNFILGDGGGFPGRMAAEETTIGLQVESEGMAVQYKGDLLSQASGQVRNAASAQALPGATVTLLAPAQSGEDVVFVPWSDSELSQANPAATDVAGTYGFSVPSNRYQLYVTAEGYQPYRTNNVVVGSIVNQVISLTQSIDGQPDVIVAITESGFEPALLTVKPGSVVAFVNITGLAHRVEASNWESDLLLTGERYTIRAEDEGAIPFVDSTDSAHSGAIIVNAQEEEEEEQQHIHLPTIQR